MNNDLAVLAPVIADYLDNPGQLSRVERIIEFYDEAGVDYGHWSKDFNMHLGFYRWGLNPFDRDKMLEQMNLEVAARLKLDRDDKAFLLDLGCGTGAIARSVAKKYSRSIVKGVTLVPSQVKTAAVLNAAQGLERQIEILKGDFTALPFEDSTADGVWAVEGACYADGAAKEDLAREMARVLKPGGRFVVADCFIKRPDRKLDPLTKRSYRSVCHNWALSEMPEVNSFVTAMKGQSFTDVIVEDISWRVVPSVAHAPFAVFSFMLNKLLTGTPIKQQSVNNLKASLLTMALGLNRAKFSYCMISGRRGDDK